MIENLMNNHVVWIILAVCTVVGLPSFIFSIYFQYKNKRKRELSYSFSSYKIIEKGNRNIEKLRITYDGEEINVFSVTRYTIWNSGCEEIRSEDIAAERPFNIRSFGDTKILDAEIVVENEKSNKFSLIKTDLQNIIMDFEYVDPNEGIVIQVLHSGTPKEIELDCKIKGGRKLQFRKNDDFVENGYRNQSELFNLNIYCVSLALLILFSLVLSIGSLLSLLGIGRIEYSSALANALFVFSAIVFAYSVYKFIVAIKRRRTFKRIYSKEDSKNA